MLINIYTIYDSKAAAYLQPFFAMTDGVAQRQISDAILEPDHQFAKHTEDFTLYRLAIFDDSDGGISPKKQLLITLLELKAQKSNVIPINTGEQT